MKRTTTFLTLILLCFLLAGCSPPALDPSMEGSVDFLSDTTEEVIGSAVLSKEDSDALIEILKKGPWEEGTCWCTGDAILTVGGQTFNVHFNGDITGDGRTRNLSREEEKTVYNILKKYI